MSASPTPAALLDRQASVLRTQLGGVYDGDIEAVHNARVATRRIRELLTLVPMIPGRDCEDDAAAGYADIGRALGRVRDIDVQIALITEIEAHAYQTAPSLVLVRQDHEGDRLVQMRRLIKTLERLKVDALLHVVSDGHPAGLRTRLTSAGWRAQLRHLVLERARVAVDRVAHATGVYFPNRVHSARIAIKRLRYAAEIVEATGLSDIGSAIKTLSKAQTILGDLHDRQALADRLLGYQKHDGVEAEHLKATRHVLAEEVREMHAKYLDRRSSVRAACAELEHLASHTARHARALAIGGTLAATGLVCIRWALADQRRGAHQATAPPDTAVAVDPAPAARPRAATSA